MEIEGQHQIYLFVSESLINGVWFYFDYDQRNIFEENYKCRGNQIKYLIRKQFKKSLVDRQSYKRVWKTTTFESDNSRVESAAEAESQGLEDMEGRSDIRSTSGISDRSFDCWNTGGRDLNVGEDKF